MSILFILIYRINAIPIKISADHYFFSEIEKLTIKKIIWKSKGLGRIKANFKKKKNHGGIILPDLQDLLQCYSYKDKVVLGPKEKYRLLE